MRRFMAVLMLVLVWSIAVGGGQFHGIVNNSGNSNADTISIPFYVQDSTGNMVAMAAGDSVFLVVFYPHGLVAQVAENAYDGVRITARTVSNFTVYSYKAIISAIDGATPVNGCYSYVLVGKDITGTDFMTPRTGTFWLYQTADLNVTLDSMLVNMEDGAITATKIATDAIGSAELAAGAITASEIANNAFVAENFATGAISANALATDAVSEIADGVWDEDTTGHFVKSKYGYEAVDRWWGYGIYTITRVLLDTTDGDTTAISNVFVQYVDTTSDIKIVNQYSNTSGIVSGTVPASTYYVYKDLPGYTWEANPDTITISANSTDTSWATSTSPGTGLVYLYVNMDDLTGSIVRSARVQVWFNETNVRDTLQNKLVSNFEEIAYTDTLGQATLTLIPSKHLEVASGDSVKYNARITSAGRIIADLREFWMPDTASYLVYLAVP